MLRLIIYLQIIYPKNTIKIIVTIIPLILSKLVDLYLTSNLNVDAINHKNEMIKKEIQKLNNKKDALDPDNEFKEYTLELSKKLDCVKENDEYIFTNNLGFSFVWDSLNRKTKRDLIQRLIALSISFNSLDRLELQTIISFFCSYIYLVNSFSILPNLFSILSEL